MRPEGALAPPLGELAFARYEQMTEGVPLRTRGHSPSHGLPFGPVRASPLIEGAEGGCAAGA